MITRMTLGKTMGMPKMKMQKPGKMMKMSKMPKIGKMKSILKGGSKMPKKVTW